MSIGSFTRPRWDTNTTDNLYVTSCKLCRHGIYKGQPWRWLDRPVGISHEACAYRQGILAYAVGARVLVPTVAGDTVEPGTVVGILWARAGGVWEYDIRVDSDGRVIASQPRHVATSGR